MMVLTQGGDNVENHEEGGENEAKESGKLYGNFGIHAGLQQKQLRGEMKLSMNKLKTLLNLRRLHKEILMIIINIMQVKRQLMIFRESVNISKKKL